MFSSFFLKTVCSSIFGIFAFGQLYSAASSSQLRINVFSVSNGVGLERDRKILADALRELGHLVQERETHKSLSEQITADVHIYFEIIDENRLSEARLNWFIPNPEYYFQGPAILDKIDLILCRTHQVERIFQDLDRPTYFLGFTSLDRYDNRIDKDFHSFLHLAGASPTKNTKAVVDLWQNNRYLPLLTVIRHNIDPPLAQHNVHWFSSRIAEEPLLYFQNYHGIHLCPSTAEGYGHYIMEAMSTGAVVITTNGAPMNEFIADDRCLVPYSSTAPQALGTAYFANANQLASVVFRLLHLPLDELKKIGTTNRKVYLRKTKEFHDNLRNLFESEALQKASVETKIFMTDSIQ